MSSPAPSTTMWYSLLGQRGQRLLLAAWKLVTPAFATYCGHQFLVGDTVAVPLECPAFPCRPYSLVTLSIMQGAGSECLERIGILGDVIWSWMLAAECRDWRRWRRGSENWMRESGHVLGEEGEGVECATIWIGSQDISSVSSGLECRV